MSAFGRFETTAAVRFGSIEWPTLTKVAFRPLSGLTVFLQSGLSHYKSYFATVTYSRRRE
jgi:hypothetical protein